MVVTVERLPDLAAGAEATLLALDYRNVVVEMAGPVLGCPERGPYDVILVAAAARPFRTRSWHSSGWEGGWRCRWVRGESRSCCWR